MRLFRKHRMHRLSLSQIIHATKIVHIHRMMWKNNVIINKTKDEMKEQTKERAKSGPEMHRDATMLEYFEGVDVRHDGELLRRDVVLAEKEVQYGLFVIKSVE